MKTSTYEYQNFYTYASELSSLELLNIRFCLFMLKNFEIFEKKDLFKLVHT